MGSSPHTRGLLPAMLSNGEYVRIIPAYAGPTNSFEFCSNVVKDHPRIRGAYLRCRSWHGDE